MRRRRVDGVYGREQSLRASWERWRCRLDAVVAIARDPPATASPIDAATRCCPRRGTHACPRRVDLKGEKHLPDSVKHLVVPVDPSSLDIRELAKQSLDDDKRVTTDSVHRKGDLEKFEAPQLLKGDVKAVLETSRRSDPKLLS